jgi:hypothetical protein
MLSVKKNISNGVTESNKDTINEPALSIKQPKILNNVFSNNKQLGNPEPDSAIQTQIEKISEFIKSEKKESKITQPIINKKIVCNVINPDDPSTIMVTFNQDTFSFYNNKKSHLGFFTIKQLIKYIVNDSSYLSEIATGTSNVVIETFVCSHQDNKIKLYDHIASIFMGNLEMLIKLNNSLYQFEKEEEQKNVDKKILLKIKAFIFTLLNHTLKIISTISSENKANNNTEIKYKLMKYSVNIIYRMISYIRERFIYNIENTMLINSNIEKLIITRNDINQKIELLNTAVLQQTDKIDILINKIDNGNLQIGGNTKSENTESENTESENEDSENEESENEESETENYEDDSEGALTESVNDLTGEYFNNSSDEHQIDSLTDSEVELNQEASIDNNFNSEPNIESTSDKKIHTSPEIDTASNNTTSEYSKIDELSQNNN